MTLGQKIAILRTAQRLSQEQLAEKLSVSRQSVSKWESDKALPEINTVLEISRLFGITTDDLLHDETPLEPTYTEPLFRPKENIDYNLKYFGTDGFRGEAGTNLTADHAYKIGRFLGWYYSSSFFTGKRDNTKKVKVVIGKDTRRSSYMFEYAIVAGLTASGADAYLLHVTTTPSVSYVVLQDNFDCGIMISASHNPFYDNGIKLINSFGEKMDDYTLSLIEKYIDNDLDFFSLESDLPYAKREYIGKTIDYTSGRNRYVGYLISIAANSYKNLNIALDCANGSAWMIAQSVFNALGAKAHIINAEPDGVNINLLAGSTNIGSLRKYVRENHCDVGFAFDGDADRLIAVDENGDIVNGDHVIYILANMLKKRGLLHGNQVVATVMSNLGLFKALEEAGIDYIQTTVGDRFVHAAMMENDISIGGEQSGHTIVRKYASTGDGILTAILLAECMVDNKTTLSRLAAPVKMYPQVVKNITVTSKSEVANDDRILKEVEEINKALEGNGRILLRESGTEPVIRVMVESDTQKKCEAFADKVIKLINDLGYAK